MLMNCPHGIVPIQKSNLGLFSSFFNFPTPSQKSQQVASVLGTAYFNNEGLGLAPREDTRTKLVSRTVHFNEGDI